jgi:N-acyl-L-homoserine lactone synthetase
MNDSYDSDYSGYLLMLFAGLFIGVGCVRVADILMPNSLHNKYYNAIQECEKDLPRSEHCVLVALPRSKD